MSRLEERLTSAWYEGAWWLWFLRPIELLFRSLSLLRCGFYSSGLLSTYRAPCPVVVVGNITVGGTGKTPVVIALVEALQAKGIRPGVVSRGYGATASEFPHLVTAQSTAAQCGDEPLLIFARTGAPVAVAPDRPAAVQALLQGGEVDLVISDDGLQHYALQRDLEIVVMDGRRGLGNGYCLPAGPLREPRSRLAGVNFQLQRGGTDPLSAVHYKVDGLINLLTGEERELSAAGLGAVYAVAGIGQPQQFFASLEGAGLEVTTRVFADHHHYSKADLAALQDRPIIMTEKDAVKCRSIAGDNAWYLRISARLPPAVIEAVSGLVGR